jgi:hypothetical protein
MLWSPFSDPKNWCLFETHVMTLFCCLEK